MKISRQPLLRWVYLGLSCVLLHGGQAIAQSDISSAVVIEERSAETDMLHDVLAAMDNAFAKVKTVHYRRTSDTHVPEQDIKRYHKKIEAMEQVYQGKPRSSHYTMHPDAHYLVRGRENLAIVPEQKKIISRTKKEKHQRAWLKGIYKFNSEHLLYWYDLEVEQLPQTPPFLFIAYDYLDGQALYSQTSLYRITGTYQEHFVSKDPNFTSTPILASLLVFVNTGGTIKKTPVRVTIWL